MSIHGGSTSYDNAKHIVLQATHFSCNPAEDAVVSRRFQGGAGAEAGAAVPQQAAREGTLDPQDFLTRRPGAEAGTASRPREKSHPRAGELVAVAEPEAWFTYYYWLDDERAPDFARTVEIHRASRATTRPSSSSIPPTRG